MELNTTSTVLGSPCISEHEVVKQQFPAAAAAREIVTDVPQKLSRYSLLYSNLWRVAHALHPGMQTQSFHTNPFLSYL